MFEQALYAPKLVTSTFLLAVFLFFSFESQTQPIEPLGEYAANELLIKFARNVKAEDRILKSGSVTLASFDEIGWRLVRLPPGMTLGQGLAHYKSMTGVDSVQPNFLYRTQAVPNDPRYPQLYALKNTGQIGGTPGADIRAEEAWNFETGSRSVVVAVIDLGVDYNHEDLSANMWRNPGESGVDAIGNNKASNNIDDDGNGYIDDLYGIDTINHDSNPMDDSGHGTHVAGTIGAVGNNTLGVVGVNWAVSIMAIKSHDVAGNGTSASVIEAFQYATMMRNRGINVRVTNSSWGGAPEAASFDQALKDAIELAGNAGILNVCAAGNTSNNNDANPFYPASYDLPGILAVAASDQNDARATFSNYGSNSVDIAAPGVGILSTYRGSYSPLSGTSMATPHVSGAAALLCAYNPYLNRTQLKSLLMSSSDLLPSSWGQTPIGTGRLNVLRALQSIPTTNEIDSAPFFVAQHYQDFLGRAPDPGGLAYWTNEITRCGNDAACIRERRIGVSGAFFAEREFQQTGSFVYRLYKGGLGRLPTFAEFSQDRSQVVDVNLDSSKQAFALVFVQRRAFVQKYVANTDAGSFVDALISTIRQGSNLDLAGQRAALIAKYNQGTDMDQSRALALREAIESAAFINTEFNPSFVLMQYFGYLQRDPDQGGYAFWLNVLNNREPGNYRGMICAFLTSAEYQVRFAPVVTRTNSECGP